MSKISVCTHTLLIALNLTLAASVVVAQSPSYVEPVYVNNVPQKSVTTQQTTRMPTVEELPAEHVSNGLTLENLIAMAEANNPSLREASALVQAAQGRWLQAGLPPNPVAGYSGQQIASRGLAEQQGVYMSQQIVTGGKLRLNREVMAQEIQMAIRNYEVQRLRVQTDVAMYFFDAYASQQRLETTKELTRISLESIATVESLIRANEGTKIELLQARLESENTRLLQLQAENRVGASWRSLGAVVGNLNEAPQPLEGTLAAFPRPADFDTVYERLISNSPEIGSARAKIERMRWDYQLARRERLPNMDVQGLVQKDEGVNLFDGALQITMPLPVWDRKQGRISEAYAMIATAEQAEQRLRLNLRQKLAVAYERYLNADQQISRYEQQVLPAAEEQFKLVSEAKRAGEVNYIIVLFAQRSLAQARLAYLDAQRERAVSASQIQGMLLNDSLQNGAGP